MLGGGGNDRRQPAHGTGIRHRPSLFLVVIPTKFLHAIGKPQKTLDSWSRAWDREQAMRLALLQGIPDFRQQVDFRRTLRSRLFDHV